VGSHFRIPFSPCGGNENFVVAISSFQPYCFNFPRSGTRNCNISNTHTPFFVYSVGGKFRLFFSFYLSLHTHFRTTCSQLPTLFSPLPPRTLLFLSQITSNLSHRKCLLSTSVIPSFSASSHFDGRLDTPLKQSVPSFSSVLIHHAPITAISLQTS
jgi:hypothetical protein